MADENSLKAIWDATDKYYIQATTKTKGNSPVNENGGIKKHGTLRHKCDSESDSDDAESYLKDELISNGSGYKSEESQDKFNSKTLGNFAAIPVEFRPNVQGKNLYKIRTPPRTGGPGRIMHTKEASGLPSNLENDELLIDLTEEKNMKSNHFPTFQSNVWNDNVYFGTELKAEEKQSHNESSFHLTTDEAGKREMFRGKFFYNDGLLEKSPLKKSGENVHQQLSEKSNSKIEKNKQTHGGLFYSTSNKSKTTNFNINSQLAQLKSGNKTQSYAVRGRQNKTEKERNKLLYEGNCFQKVTREVTVEKKMNWNNDLCTFKKSSDKPHISYKYTSKVVSDKYFPLEVNKKVTENEQKYCDAKRHFYNDRRPQNFKTKFKNTKDEGFDYRGHFTTERKQNKQFAKNNSQNCSRNPRRNLRNINFQVQNTNSEIPVIRHEIKVIHVNDSGKAGETLVGSHQEKYCEMIDINNQPGRNTGIARKYLPHDDKTKKGKADSKITTNEICGKLENLSLTPKQQNVLVPRNETASTHLLDINSNDNTVLLINHGREISDLIVGSHVAMSTFLAVFSKWKELRGVTLLLFEELEKNLSQICNKNKKVKEIAGLFNAGVNVVQFVPNPKVAVFGKIVAVLSDLVTNVFTSSSKMKDVDLNDFQLRMGLQTDIDAATEVYMHGLQCDQQFRETRKLIEDFHSDIQNGSYKEFIETFDIEFLKDISKLNPRYPDVYYKKLEKCFKRLKNEGSVISAAFYRDFEDWPDAMATISRLHRKFNVEFWNSKAVVNAWEEIYDILQDGNSLVRDVLKKIQDCILVLIRERSIFEKYAMDLKNDS